MGIRRYLKATTVPRSPDTATLIAGKPIRVLEASHTTGKYVVGLAYLHHLRQ